MPSHTHTRKCHLSERKYSFKNVILVRSLCKQPPSHLSHVTPKPHWCAYCSWWGHALVLWWAWTQAMLFLSHPICHRVTSQHHPPLPSAGLRDQPDTRWKGFGNPKVTWTPCHYWAGDWHSLSQTKVCSNVQKRGSHSFMWPMTLNPSKHFMLETRCLGRRDLVDLKTLCVLRDTTGPHSPLSCCTEYKSCLYLLSQDGSLWLVGFIQSIIQLGAS